MNVELEVREIIVQTTALPSVEYVFSYTDIPVQEDDHAFFWREIETKYSIVVTKAQRAQIKTVGEAIAYLKWRIAAAARHPALSFAREGKA